VGLAVYGLWPEDQGRAVIWSDLSGQVGPLTITRETKRVFRSRSALAGYLATGGGRVPAIDFSRRQALLVSPGPRSSTGYVVEVVQVRERDGQLTVTVRELTPSVGERVAPRVTFPYRLLSLPAGKQVYVDWPGRA
jgi:hypothetical protein